MNSSSFHKGTTDIVCLSLSRWDAPVSSPAISLCKELALTNRLFYIEHPFSWKDYLKENQSDQIRLRKRAFTHHRECYLMPPGYPKNFTVVTPPLVNPINFLPPGVLYDRLSEINSSIVLKCLRKVLVEKKISRFLFINFFDPFFLRSFPNDIRPEQYIYQCMDDIAEESYTGRHGVSLEKEIFRTADKVLCTSTELTRLASKHSSHVFLHPNAADVELFQRAVKEDLQRPPDLPIGKKIIGFTGSLEYRTDFELVKEVARRHKDKILFLIGPIVGTDAEDAGVFTIPNIMVAGARPLSELPAYLKYFDCCIIPYKKNKLTRSIYPLKINEYLSAGKPVISTNFSVDIASFKDHAYIANSYEDFLAAIDEAIDNDSEALRLERVEAAAINSWKKRAEQFWEIVG